MPPALSLAAPEIELPNGPVSVAHTELSDRPTETVTPTESWPCRPALRMCSSG